MNKLMTCVLASLVLFSGAALAQDRNNEHKRGGGGKGGGDRPSSRPAPQVHRGAPEVRQQAAPRRANPPAAHSQNRPRPDAGPRRVERPAARPPAAEQRERATAQKRQIEQQAAK